MVAYRNTRCKCQYHPNENRRNCISHLKKLIFILILLFSPISFARWGASLGHAGFFGNYVFGGQYEFDVGHSAELSFGTYSSEGAAQHYQLNVAYRNSLWRVPLAEKTWVPLQLGIFAIRALGDGNFFLKSPTIYPQGYYDPTILRWGFEFNTLLVFLKNRYALSYHLRILDTGLVVLYNNYPRDLRYYYSSGISFQYRF